MYKLPLSFLLWMLYLLNTNVIAQSSRTTKSQGGFFEQVYDQYGYAHPLSELEVDPKLPNTLGGGGMPQCNSGYFEAYFEDGSGFEILTNALHIARRDVLCAVFSNLSNFIIPANSNTHVRIHVLNLEDLNLTSNAMDGTLAAASSYYAFPMYYSSAQGIADNLVWKTINSGQDAYVDVASTVLSTEQTNYFHAYLVVNFRDEDDNTSNNNTSPINWNNSLSSYPTNSEYDLYTLLLHELTHMLGFVSLISDDGTSRFGENDTDPANDFPYLSRYDTFLRLSDGDGGHYLISDDELCSPMYEYTWNADISGLPSDHLSPGCAECLQDPFCLSFSTECAGGLYGDPIQFGDIAGTALATPHCFQEGTSLSHLSFECSPYGFTDGYVMREGFSYGDHQRHCQQEERLILCSLGYHINDSFGDDFSGNPDVVLGNEVSFTGGVCGGEQITGRNDGIEDQFSTPTYSFTAFVGQTISLTGSDLLANDAVNGVTLDVINSPEARAECLEIITGGGTLNTTLSVSDGWSDVFEYTSSTVGLKLLRYVPVRNGIRGNITYCFIYVSATTPTSSYEGAPTLPCTPSPCMNLVKNSGFEIDAEYCSRRVMDGMFYTACWFGGHWSTTNMILRQPVYFTDAITYEGVGGDEDCFNNTDILSYNNIPIPTDYTTQNYQPALNSYTCSNPVTDTREPVNNHGLCLIFATASTGGGMSNVRSTSPLATLLDEAIIPGESYVLSYWAKTLKSNIGANYFYGTNVLQPASYFEANTNKSSYVRFHLIEDSETSINQWVTSDIGSDPNAYGLTELTQGGFGHIPSISPNGDASDDWHYREAVITIPNDFPTNLQNLVIDFDIWQAIEDNSAAYENCIVGFFIDDISLTHTVDDIVDLPAAICPGSVIENLNEYVTASVVNGIFTCTDCPPSAQVDENMFNTIGLPSGSYHFIFSYETTNGCHYQEGHTVEISEGGCCPLQIVVDQVMDSPCAAGAFGKAFITVYGATENYSVNWQGPTSSTEEDPQNLLPGTYTVTVSTGELCNVSTTVVIGVLPSVDLPTINSQELADQYLNNQIIHVDGDLVFSSPNTSWEVHDCELYFDAGHKITVTEDAGVGFFNVVLDACGASWVGVVLRSQHSTPANGGMIKLADYLTVRHAEIGISTNDGDNLVGNENSSVYRCGSMFLDHCTFVDNKTAISVRKGNTININPGPGLKSDVQIANSDFIWTPDIINHFPGFFNSASSLYMINFTAYKDATVTDCNFINSVPTNNWSDRGTAIYLYDSDVDVIGSDPDLPTSRIEGFNFGVRSSAVSLNVGSILQGIYAERNKVALQATQSDFIKMNRNIVQVGMPWTNPGMIGLNATATKYEGISLRQSTGYEVSENEITGFIEKTPPFSEMSPPYAVGISIINSLSPNEEVYRNFLNNLNYGNVANGNNNSSEDLGGLRYVCNLNDNNDYDFVVADFPGLSGAANIGEIQTDFTNTTFEDQTERAAGNSFSVGNTHANNDFMVEAQPGGVVYKYFPQTPEIPVFMNSVVTAIEFNEQNACASEIFAVGNQSASANLPILNDLNAVRDESKQKFLDVFSLKASLMDGGDSEALLGSINALQDVDSEHVTAKLKEYSPYLSDRVLYAIIDNADMFSNAVISEIILSNPHILSDKNFINRLLEKNNPMPDYMVDQLLNAQTSPTSRTLLDEELIIAQSRFIDASQKALHLQMLDSDYTMESHFQELRLWKSLAAHMYIIDYFLKIHDYDSALEEFDFMVLNCVPGMNEMGHVESYQQWMNLCVRIGDGPESLESLSPSDLEELISLATTYPYYSGGIRAAEVLNAYYGGQFYLEPFTPSVQDIATSDLTILDPAMLLLIKTYPDPASEFVNIQLSLPDQMFRSPIIKIYDGIGKQILEFPVSNSEAVVTLNTNAWSTGLYHVVLYSGDEIKYSTKLSILK